MGTYDHEQVLQELVEAAAKVGLTVTFDALSAGDGVAGGLCKVKGAWRLIGDRRATPREKIDLVATALARFDTATADLSEPARAALARGRRT